MKVSIITVTYNSAATLSRTIRSVCRQTYPNIEYIIVDGESADTTMNVVHNYAEKYSNISYISEPDRGIYDAINKGIRMSTGEIVALVNSDDVLAESTTIERIVKRMQETNADILYGDLQYCKYELTEHNPPRVTRYWKSNSFRKRDLRLGWMPAHPTLYCRREVFDKVGYYTTDLRISADYDFCLRAFSDDNLKKVYLPEVIIKMEVGGISNRNIRSMARKTKEDYIALRRNGYRPLIVLFMKNVRKFRQFFRR